MMIFPSQRVVAPPESPLGRPPEFYRLTGWACALIVAYGASLLLFNLGSTRTLTFHEVLFAQPAKEMLATGNWVLPKFAGVPSTHKPPGTHWLIAAVMAVTGSKDEAIVRLPAVLAALVTALLIAGFAARWYGTRIGVYVGLMQLTAYSGLQMARLAESDMPLTAAVCGAMCTFAIANIDSPRGRVKSRWMPVLFYACVGAAYLFKGFIGPAFIMSGAVAYTAWNRDRDALRFLCHPWGLLLAAGIVLGWLGAAGWQYPPLITDQIMHHFGRFQGEMGGNKSPLFYTYTLLLVTLPWAPLVIWGVWKGLRSGQHRTTLGRFLACWVVPGLALLCLSSFKSKHYTAPLVPPLTMVAALALGDYIRRRHRISHGGHLLWGLTSLVACLVGITVVLVFRPKGADAIAALIGTLGAALLVMTYCEYRKHALAEVVALFAGTWLIAGGALSYVLPHHDSYRDQTELALRANQSVPVGEPILLVELLDNQIAYYLDHPLARIDTTDELAAAFADAQRPVYALAPACVVSEFEQLGNVEVLDRCETVTRSQSKDEHLTLLKWTRMPRQLAAASVENIERQVR